MQPKHDSLIVRKVPLNPNQSSVQFVVSYASGIHCYELCSGKTYGYSNEYQTVVIKLLLYQNIQYQNNYSI